MTEYIKREEAIKAIHKWLSDILGISDVECRVLDKRLQAIPSADVVERKHGEWDDKKVSFYLKCSECGCCVRAFVGEAFLDYSQEWNFCPNCGADMRG